MLELKSEVLSPKKSFFRRGDQPAADKETLSLTGIMFSDLRSTGISASQDSNDFSPSREAKPLVIADCLARLFRDSLYPWEALSVSDAKISALSIKGVVKLSAISTSKDPVEELPLSLERDLGRPKLSQPDSISSFANIGG